MTADERRFSYKVVVAAIGILLAGWLGMWLMGWDDKVAAAEQCANGGVTRPYPELEPLEPAALPCLVHIQFDGAGHAVISGYNPGPHTFTAATFHVPDPNRWLDDQELTDSETIPPATEFGFLLDCAPGAAQADIWLDGQTEPYAAATTLNCGEQESFSAPAPTAAPVDTLRGGDTPDGVPQDAAAGVTGEQGVVADASAATPPPPAAIHELTGPALAATPEVQVLGVRASLPDTGGAATTAIVGLIVLAGGALIFAATRKAARS